MKVLKFGGTSVGTVDSLRNVKQIVEGESKPVVVVVSALGGLTDKLIATARMASQANQEYLDSFDEISNRHHHIVDTLVPESKRERLLERVDELLDELKNIFRGISLIKDLPDRTLDTVVSYGERLSSLIISRIIDNATLFDSLEFIKTTREGGRNVLDSELTNKLVKTTFANRPFEIAVVPGFIATDRNGTITNLGRGGSDYTASILAAELSAECLEIWTDVDGFMTADPRVINTAYKIDSLSYVEAMELCNFGAKVVYPPTIYPAFQKNIPLLIKNTFNPTESGTLISNEPGDSSKPIKGISSIKDTALITITALGMVGILGINARIFSCLANNGVSVSMVATGSSENNTSFAVKNADADLAVKVLKEEFKKELREGLFSDITASKNLAMVAVVGENMKNHSGIAGKLFNTLGRNGINVVAVAQGASEINISFVVSIKDIAKTLNVIHDQLFLSQTQVLNLFVAGLGNVGGRLLCQLKKQQEKLRTEKSLEIKLVGITNSRKALFDAEGIDPVNYEERLDSEGRQTSPEEIAAKIVEMNIYNPVFVDCTANAEMADIYGTLLNNNVNIVAANKIAASSPMDNYLKLKQTAVQRDIKFLFETNVGAGLPIISTINNLINSGDKILRIEAVVSGTLNFIFDVLSEEVPFSKAVEMARKSGFSEPDPRIDLSGGDVIRKIVILAREAGYRIEQTDVVREPLIPSYLFDGSVEDFFKHLPEVDEEMENLRRRVNAENKRFRFIATLDSNGKASVGLRAVDSSHPFYFLQSSNNIIALTTDRYHEFPIIIKGYGAGAEVTAAGVFADIISIANVR